MKRLQLLALSLGIISIYGCNKNEKNNFEISNDKKLTNITTSNGMLKFESNEIFLKTLAEFDQKGLSFAKQKLQSLKYTSYLTDTLNDNKIVGDIDPILSLLINNNNAVQIGDSIKYFTKKNEYSIPASDIELYRKIEGNIESFNNNSIKKEAVKYLPIVIQKEASAKASTLSGFGEVFNDTYTFFTPEDNVAGRPERVKFVYETKNVSGLLRSTFTAYGEAYRKGGVFGSKKWRSIGIDAINYDILKSKRRNQPNYDTPTYNITLNWQEEVTVYATAPGSWVNELEVRFNRINFGSNDYAATFHIQEQNNGSYSLSLTKNW